MKNTPFMGRLLHATAAASLLLGGLAMIPGFIASDAEAMRMMFIMGALAPVAMLLAGLLFGVPIYILFRGTGTTLNTSPQMKATVAGAAIGAFIASIAAAYGMVPAVDIAIIAVLCGVIGYLLSAPAKKETIEL